MIPGTPTLTNLAHDQIKNFSADDHMRISKIYQQLLEIYDSEDYLWNFFGQYDYRNPLNYTDAVWAAKLNDLVFNKHIYATCFKIPAWANPDKCKKDNISLLKNLPFEVFDGDGRNDGFFKTTQKLKLKELIFEESKINDIDNLPIIDFEGHGHIEYGTQSLAKTTYALIQNIALLRIPYKFTDKITPRAYLFINKLNLYDSFFDINSSPKTSDN